jgi:5,10-methylenetetrahydromethanopterin reductase
MKRIGLFLGGNYACHETLRYAKLGEERGYDSVWLAEDLGFRDAMVPLASIAVSTTRIKLATGILPIHYRSPALAAMTAATLAELSGGRLILGLGNGAPRFLSAQSIDSRKPLDALREYIEIIRRILKGDPVNHRGRFHNLTDVKLAFKPPRQEIPIYIAARRKMMFQLAGEIADGVLLSDGFCSESYIRWARENVRQGMEKTRRDHNVDFCCLILLSISPDYEQAKENVKPPVLTILSRGYLDPFLEMWGLTAADVAPAREAWIKGNIIEACKKTPDALIDGSAIYGTPHDCSKKMARLRAAGIDLPVIRPVGLNVESAIELAKNW